MIKQGWECAGQRCSTRGRLSRQSPATGCAHSATAGWTGERNRTSYSGAPGSTKIGTIALPWHYDAGAYHVLQPERLRLPTILHHASWWKSSDVESVSGYPSLDSRRAGPPWESTRCPTTRHGIYHFRFASGFATSRAQSMKSCVTGLSVRFFRVTLPFARRAIGSSTGKTLISAPGREFHCGSRENRDKAPGLIRTLGESVTTVARG